MKRTRKRILAFLMMAALIAALSACSSSGNTQNTPTPEPASVAEASTAESVAEVPPVTDTAQAIDPEDNSTAGDSRILIAYFAVAENSEVDAVSSASVLTINGEAKGKIAAVAETIQDNVGGDLFSIQTSVQYSGNIMELIDYAAEELADNERPELTARIENLDKYDVIFIGYPTWWYDLPMVMYSFLEEYDLAGKTIVPFNTHNGSRFSGTTQTIQSIQPGIALLDGYTVHENSMEDVAGDVPQWLREIGLL